MTGRKGPDGPSSAELLPAGPAGRRKGGGPTSSPAPTRGGWARPTGGSRVHYFVPVAGTRVYTKSICGLHSYYRGELSPVGPPPDVCELCLGRWESAFLVRKGGAR